MRMQDESERAEEPSGQQARPTVLLVSGNQVPEHELASRLAQDCVVHYASDIQTMKDVIESLDAPLAACVIDSVEFGEDTLQVIKHFSKDEAEWNSPVFLVVDDIGDELLEKGYEAGVTDIIIRPYTPYAHRRIMNVIHLNEAGRKVNELYLQARDAREEAQNFLARVPGGFFRYKVSDVPGEDTFDFLSPELLEIAGFQDEEQFRDHTNNVFHDFVHPDEIEAVEANVRQQIDSDGNANVTYRIVRPDGQIRWINDVRHLVEDIYGQKWHYVVVLDVTDQVELAESLKRSNDRMSILSELVNDVIFDVDCESGKVDVFGDFKKRFGREFAESDFRRLAKCEADEVCVDCDIDINPHDAESHGFQPTSLDIALPNLKGDPTWALYQAVILRDEEGNPERYVGRLLDTHEEVVKRMKYKQSAERDDLTGLYNREAALERFREVLKSKPQPYSLLFIDVDDFKSVNDVYGHPLGDKVLKHVADHLISFSRGNDIVARFGGDEFAMFIIGLPGGKRLEEIVRQISKQVFEAFVDDAVDDPLERFSISIGVASTTDPSIPLDEIYESADKALYNTKLLGKNSYTIAR